MANFITSKLRAFLTITVLILNVVNNVKNEKFQYKKNECKIMKTWNTEKEIRNSWWNSKRLKYNTGIIISGIVSFILYLIIVEFVVLKSSKDWEGEITIFSLFFQGIGFLIMLGLANVFYSLGSFSEKIIKPKNTEKYRNNMFSLGYWFSFSLPMLIPISLLIEYL
ncbi:MAG: hypothetical protein L3J09_02875 [Flavobacteriaceae bacterium]|nr:hypothetical protein [Flavobacteriaceae bacterium]